MSTNTDIFKQQNKSTITKMPTNGGNSGSLLDEPKLYISKVPLSMSEKEVSNVFTDVPPVKVEINRQPSSTTNQTTGSVHFASIEQAEKAFAVYNNTSLEVYKTNLKLLLCDPSLGNEPPANAIILHVKQLPPSTTNLNLFSLFRKYGPLYSVRIQIDKTTNIFKGQGLVQFIYQEDADRALSEMHFLELEGKSLSVQQFHPRSTRPTSIRTNSMQSSNGSLGQFSPGSNYSNQQPPQSPGPEGPFVDPCNLFIKNLDANISSSDLFNHFRKFGRIISARVMRDQETGNSKGFGFVSYTTATEADAAKSAMNNKTLGSKQIVVRLHEPKKMREAKLANHFSSPSSPSESRAPSRRNSDLFPINAVNEYDQESLSGLAPKARKEVLMSELQKRFRMIPSVPQEEVNPIIDHLLTMKLAEVLHILKDPAALQAKIHEARHALQLGQVEKKLRSSDDAVQPIVPNNTTATMTPQVTEREKFTKAIQRIAPRNAESILELIMTLNKRERTLCYFNSEHLNKKILEANAACELTHEDDQSTTPSSPHRFHPSADITPASTPPSIKSPEPSSLNSILPSHSVPKVNEMNVTITNGVRDASYVEIDQFLRSIESRPTNEKKQKLGYMLFPKVKATIKALGMKARDANKVTINLLDTDDLRELAYTMNDPEKFRDRVGAAAAKILAGETK